MVAGCNHCSVNHPRTLCQLRNDAGSILPIGEINKKYTIMEAFTLIKMKEALDRIRKSSGYKVCNKVCALRERHAILYDLTEEQFGIVKHIALRRNVEEGSCRMIDRNKIPD